MKKKLFLVCSTVFFITSIQAQSACSKYYPLQEGTTFQYTTTNKKGKIEGTMDYRISNVSDDSGTTTATFDLKYTDKKGKEVFNSDYTIACSGDGIKIDFESLFPNQMMKQYEDMGLEMDISGTDIQIPNTLNVGEDLKDANVSVTMSMSGVNINITVDQTNRRVEKKEKVTTSAGTFDCYLIAETTTTKTMGATQESNNKIWLAEGVGMVKQESYKKNGDLLNRMELTEFSN